MIPNSTGDQTNIASVSSGETDPRTGDNTAIEITTVNPAADLSITKVDSPDPVLLGSALTYTLTIINNGPSEATAVTFTDTLPAGSRFASASADCDESGGIVTCSIGTISAGSSDTVGIVVIPTTIGTITNTARVTSDVGDTATGDNHATQATTVNPAADLTLGKADSPDPVLLGTQLSYTLTVTNKGPSEAPGVTITDTLPASVSYVSASPDCLEVGGTVTCAIGSLASGDGATVGIVVTPTAAGAITNTARVTSNIGDPSAGDNESTQTTAVIAAADLSITKMDSPDPVLLGSDLTYTLTITNAGPSESTGVVLTDTLPLRASFVSASPDCGKAEVTVTCDIGTLASGDSSTVTIVVKPKAVGAITNTARVSGNVADATPADNTATVITIVDPMADLVLTNVDSFVERPVRDGPWSARVSGREAPRAVGC